MPLPQGCRGAADARAGLHRGHRCAWGRGRRGGRQCWGDICLLVFNGARLFNALASEPGFWPRLAKSGPEPPRRDGTRSERAGAGSSRAGVENGLIAEPGHVIGPTPTSKHPAARSLAAQAPLAADHPALQGPLRAAIATPFVPPPGPRCCPAPLPATAAWQRRATELSHSAPSGCAGRLASRTPGGQQQRDEHRQAGRAGQPRAGRGPGSGQAAADGRRSRGGGGQQCEGRPAHAAGPITRAARPPPAGAAARSGARGSGSVRRP
jgi:hypothetical protein